MRHIALLRSVLKFCHSWYDLEVIYEWLTYVQRLAVVVIYHVEFARGVSGGISRVSPGDCSPSRADLAVLGIGVLAAELVLGEAESRWR